MACFVLTQYASRQAMNLFQILMIAGLLAGTIGFIWGAVLAFRTSVLWGLAYLFLPFGWVIFVLGNLRETKHAALIMLVGVGLVIGGVVQSPRVERAGKPNKTEHPAKEYAIEQRPAQPQQPQAPVSAADRQTELNDLIARAQRACAELNEKRAKTDPNDKAAAAAFNAEVIQYNALLDQIKTLQSQSQN